VQAARHHVLVDSEIPRLHHHLSLECIMYAHAHCWSALGSGTPVTVHLEGSFGMIAKGIGCTLQAVPGHACRSHLAASHRSLPSAACGA
jgi:hypothetical protein